MGWNARLKSGLVFRQNDGIRFIDLRLHEIEEMWLDGLEKASISRKNCPGFAEFIQYETALMTGVNTEKTGEFIGWTNGDVEFVLGVSSEKHNNHPESKIR